MSKTCFALCVLEFAAVMAAASDVMGQCPVSFASPVEYSAGTSPKAVAIGDVNGDGHADLVAANSGSNDVTVLLGNGDGTFAGAPTTYPVETNPLSVHIADFNMDGWADLAVANYGSNTVSVLLGNRDGTFAHAVNYAVGGAPLSVTAGDYYTSAGARRQFLAVANAGSSFISVLLGNSDGTFAAATNYPVSAGTTCIATGDFNGDGKPDLAATTNNSIGVSILLGSGGGTFGAAATYSAAPYSLQYLAVADVNADGRLDVVAASTGGPGTHQIVYVFLGNGDGTLQSPYGYFPYNGTPRSVAISDLNGDGKPDLAVANEFGNLSVRLGNGDGTFGGTHGVAVASYPFSLAIGDLNGDGQPDLVVPHAINNGSGSDGVSVLLNTSVPSFAPASLTDGVVGTSYDQNVNVSGGTPPYSFTITNGLPPGLSVSYQSSAVEISGTPTYSGPYVFHVNVTDSAGCSASRVYQINIACPPISFSPTTLPDGVVGTYYDQRVTVSGGTTRYSFIITNGLPPGLSVSYESSAFEISGTPTHAGSYNIRVDATDSAGCTASQAYQISITCSPSEIGISPTTLPNARQYHPYAATLVASGGLAPYRWSIEGRLPPNLTWSHDDYSLTIQGVPMQIGTYFIPVQVWDARGCSFFTSFELNVYCLALSPSSLPAGIVGALYSQEITAIGGKSPYAWSIIEGALPPGLSLSSSSGILSGTPTATGSFGFRVRAADNAGCDGVADYTVATACPALSIAPATLPDCKTGVPYNHTLTASGGTVPYSWTVTGSLPPGVVMSNGGALSGRLSATGTFSFDAQATDLYGCSRVASYTVTVDSNPCPLMGDMNGDGLVNALDFTMFIGCMGSTDTGNCACADYNCNGVVDAGDVNSYVADVLGQ